jgi:hypothetical protein
MRGNKSAPALTARFSKGEATPTRCMSMTYSLNFIQRFANSCLFPIIFVTNVNNPDPVDFLPRSIGTIVTPLFDLISARCRPKSHKFFLPPTPRCRQARTYFKSSNPCSFNLGLKRISVCTPRSLSFVKIVSSTRLATCFNSLV